MPAGLSHILGAPVGVLKIPLFSHRQNIFGVFYQHYFQDFK
jgi:hypothetical protein